MGDEIASLTKRIMAKARQRDQAMQRYREEIKALTDKRDGLVAKAKVAEQVAAMSEHERNEMLRQLGGSA